VGGLSAALYLVEEGASFVEVQIECCENSSSMMWAWHMNTVSWPVMRPRL